MTRVHAPFKVSHGMVSVLESRFVFCAVAWGMFACAPVAVSETQSPPASPSDQEGDAVEVGDLSGAVARFTVAELTADVSDLTPSESATLQHAIAAARHMDPIFDRQAWAGNPALEVELRSFTTPAGQARHAYWKIMRGPWDRQDHHAPFAVPGPRPPGAGFYPETMTADVFEAWLAAHPEDRDAFQSLTTIIAYDGEALVARPYHEVYAQWLEPAAADLRAAADTTDNASLQRFLRSRAEAFETDDYYASDKDWMDLDSRVEITIGPYETYEDSLFGFKAAYEAFVTVSDPAASAQLERFKAYLPEMEAHLPVDDAVKTERGAQSPIRVVDLVFSSGDARKSVQTIAFNLPNDERVRQEKGAKKVLLRNSIRTKFDQIMRPIGLRVLAEEHHPQLSGDAFFHQVLFHELSHSLGPAFVGAGDERVEVRLALGPLYTPLEECKADTLGVYNILFMIDRGELDPRFRESVLVSYFAGLFRSVRFGVAEAHGRGAAVQINRYVEGGAAVFDETSGRFTIDLPALERAVESLVHDLVMLQHQGDRAEAARFLDTYGVMSPAMSAALAGVVDIPLDLRPYYPLAGESPEDL